MSTELVPRKLPKGVELTDTGLLMPEGLPYDAWAELGSAIGRSRRVMTWALGDWLVFGEHAYGEKYAQAADATGYDAGSLMNLSSVCSRVKREIRREGLSMEHHRAVAFLESDDEKVAWLDKAEKHGWGREELRARVKGEQPERKQVAHDVTCPKCGHEFRP